MNEPTSKPTLVPKDKDKASPSGAPASTTKQWILSFRRRYFDKVGRSSRGSWRTEYPIGWRGSIFRGFSPTLRPATTKTTRQVATNPIIYSSIGMPRNKISDDLDHVREDSKPTQPPKQPPPRPWPLPKYTPVTISNALTHGQGYLSTHISLGISTVRGNIVSSLPVNYLSDLRDSSVDPVLHVQGEM